MKTLISSYGNGLFIIEEGKEKHFTSDNNDINIISEIYTVDNQIFLATSAGVYKFDETKEEFIQTSISSPAFGFSAGNNDDEFYVSSPSSVYNYNINNNESLEVELDISTKKIETSREWHSTIKNFGLSMKAMESLYMILKPIPLLKSNRQASKTQNMLK